jgi:hypothetical protein
LQIKDLGEIPIEIVKLLNDQLRLCDLNCGKTQAKGIGVFGCSGGNWLRESPGLRDALGYKYILVGGFRESDWRKELG